MCDVLWVSRAVFYAYRKRPECQRKREDKRHLALIRASFKNSRETYGYRRIHQDIRGSELCGKHRIGRLMKENNIRPKTRRKFKITTESKYSKPIYENRLERQLYADVPNQH